MRRARILKAALVAALCVLPAACLTGCHASSDTVNTRYQAPPPGPNAQPDPPNPNKKMPGVLSPSGT